MHGKEKRAQFVLPLIIQKETHVISEVAYFLGAASGKSSTLVYLKALLMAGALPVQHFLHRITICHAELGSSFFEYFMPRSTFTGTNSPSNLMPLAGTQREGEYLEENLPCIADWIEESNFATFESIKERKHLVSSISLS